MSRRKRLKSGCAGFWVMCKGILLCAFFLLWFLHEARALELHEGKPVFALHEPRIVRSHPRAGKKVALTFDDAPNGHTQDVLAVLETSGVRATFFLIGAQIPRHRELVSSIVAKGHDIGNHSFSHAFTKDWTEEAIAEDIARAERIILEATGRIPLYFRPPMGLVTPEMRRACGRLGYSLVLWSVDSGDWRGDDEETIITHVLQGVSPGAIILFHPLPRTVRVLPRIIRGLQDQGYEIVPLSILLER